METMTVQPIRYNGPSACWNNWLPIIPEQFADMMKIARVIDLSPEVLAFSAIHEPLTGSIIISQVIVKWLNLRQILETATATVRIANRRCELWLYINNRQPSWNSQIQIWKSWTIIPKTPTKGVILRRQKVHVAQSYHYQGQEMTECYLKAYASMPQVTFNTNWIHWPIDTKAFDCNRP